MTAMHEFVVSMIRGFTTLGWQVKEVAVPQGGHSVFSLEDPAYGIFPDGSNELLEGLIFQFRIDKRIRWYIAPDFHKGQHDSEGYEFARVLLEMYDRYCRKLRAPEPATPAEMSESMVNKLKKIVTDCEGFVGIQGAYIRSKKYERSAFIHGDVVDCLAEVQALLKNL